MVKLLRATAVAALVSLIALSGCSNTNSDSSDKQDSTQEEVELDESLTVGEMTVEYPSSWSRRPGSSEGIIYVDMDNDGLMMILTPQDASGISSESDYKTAIDNYNSSLEDSGFELYGVRRREKRRHIHRHIVYRIFIDKFLRHVDRSTGRRV